MTPCSCVHMHDVPLAEVFCWTFALPKKPGFVMCVMAVCYLSMRFRTNQHQELQIYSNRAPRCNEIRPACYVTHWQAAHTFRAPATHTAT